MRRWVVILGLVLLLPGSVRASDGKPVDRVRDTLESALRILNDPALQGPEKKEARRQQVRRLIASRFNYAEMAERSLDSHWVKLTSGQRQTFVALFGELFERSYSRLVLNSLPDHQVTYAGETVNGTRAVVKTVMVDKRGDRLPVDYQLRRPKAQWELFDVVIDGVSIVNNYHSQFNKIIQTSSFDELVKKMRVKQEEE
ncbi:MAG TPA: ABC transporter substrate-binding protein [Candidatus Methylomirabilis sp.]|nr:ABC transporter substrate-binding protein [Candidatus Methylomirabilis sp.]